MLAGESAAGGWLGGKVPLESAKDKINVDVTEGRERLEFQEGELPRGDAEGRAKSAPRNGVMAA